MNVYIGTSGELKNAYIGEVYEYSYDFIGKSVSQVQADGWSTVSGFSCDSNGAYSNTRGNTTKVIPVSLSSATNIEMVLGVYNMNESQSAFFTRDTASSGHNTGIYLSGPSSFVCYHLGGTETVVSDGTTSSGQGEVVFKMDLVAKTFVMTYLTKTWSGTITDSQVSLIRGNKYFRIGVPGNSTARLQYIKYTAGL